MENFDVDRVLTKLHDGLAGGYFRGETTTQNILCVGYYWPTLFKYAHAYFKKCKIYQKYIRRDKKHSFSLHPSEIEGPFEQWGLDIIAGINLNSSQLHKYILTTTWIFYKMDSSNSFKESQQILGDLFPWT